ncbi:MAG: tyrosine-type recombinase/integrase [Spiroplasma sp.]|nr:tyrosine-type recombinase/integrase [Spiroplasma sp.]
MKEYINYLKRNKYSENTIKTYKSILSLYQHALKDIRLIKKKLSYYFKSPNTVWTHYNVISSYLKWTKDKRLDLLKEMKLPRIPKKFMVVFNKKYLLTKTEIKDIDTLEKINKKMLIKFLFETGLRVCELNQIVTFNKKTITVIGKGNKVREIFHNFNTTNKIQFKNVTTKTIRLWTKEILGKKYTPHSIRRSHATHLLLKGANPKMVMMQLGHEKVETTFRYLQLSIEENKKIYDKFY